MFKRPSKSDLNSLLLSAARSLFVRLPRKLKLRAIGLFVVTISCSLMEALVVTISAPMISIWISPSQSFSESNLSRLFPIFDVVHPHQLSLIITSIFVLLVILNGIFRILLIHMTAHLSADAGAETAELIFEKILNQKFAYISSRNSSELISLLNEKVVIVSGLLLSVLTLINSILMVAFIWIGMAFINFKVVAIASLFFVALYVAVIYLTRKRIDTNSALISTESPRFLKQLRETFGSLRDIIFSGTEAVYLKSFSIISRKLKRIGAQNTVMSQSPRYVVETVGLSLIAIFAYRFGQNDELSSTLPLLGALAVGGQRLMPLIQVLYSAYVNIRVSRYTLIDILEVSNLPDAHEALESFDARFTDEPPYLELENVSFKYRADGPFVFSDVTLSLPHGAHLALVGLSGVGKSTLLDVLTGLLEPDSGVVLVNGEPLNRTNLKSWRAVIAYVPQVVFLIDGSIAENIAFGVPKNQIDYERVRRVCERVQLSEFINSIPDGYDAIIGERGAFLSGGQRQRLGLARALYRQPRVLILDEATNQLDAKTEKNILINLRDTMKELTIIHVTHKIDVARDYHFILELTGGGGVLKGSYEDLEKESVSFRELIRYSRSYNNQLNE